MKKASIVLGIIVSGATLITLVCGAAISAGRSAQRLDYVETQQSTTDKHVSTIENNISKIQTDLAVIRAVVTRIESRLANGH